MAQIFKPDVLLGTKLKLTSPQELFKVAKSKILSNKKMPEAFKMLLIGLLEYAHSGAEYPDKQIWKHANSSAKGKSSGITVSAVTSDFGEILGPLLLAQSDEYKPKKGKIWLEYPAKGNEGMYDYALNGVKYSAKAGSGASNVVGLSELSESKTFKLLPKSLEKEMCEVVAESESTMYQPIDAVMFLIKKGIKLPAINASMLKKGYKKGMTPQTISPKEWINILREDNVTSKYFAGKVYKPVVLVVAKVTSPKQNECALAEVTIPKNTKYENAEKVSSKHNLVGLYVRPAGSNIEGSLITSYSSSKVIKFSGKINLKAGTLVEIYAKDENAMTAKLISGVCADELESMCSNGTLDFTQIMSTFAPIFVKLTLTESAATVKLGGGGKKCIRNKNHPTNPRGIVRGKLGIQP